ncbi:hypothetical protein H696_00552 [Fonticula alba]|uniref:Transmembrane protein n=1 Tax=Fonticula alba TaxID=691883 RepID=A0A058ZHP0_FONAL|nr:hypothetical protein H696_00552 [Fonticula alba]KCV73002.1 hypothetical protein H696_00552 [Fonticula alba]|eukprot:XP_009492703.1 hypothetical protein H696_00552 [Fonticula alba]
MKLLPTVVRSCLALAFVAGTALGSLTLQGLRDTLPVGLPIPVLVSSSTTPSEAVRVVATSSDPSKLRIEPAHWDVGMSGASSRRFMATALGEFPKDSVTVTFTTEFTSPSLPGYDLNQSSQHGSVPSCGVVTHAPAACEAPGSEFFILGSLNKHPNMLTAIKLGVTLTNISGYEVYVNIGDLCPSTTRYNLDPSLETEKDIMDYRISAQDTAVSGSRDMPVRIMLRRPEEGSSVSGSGSASAASTNCGFSIAAFNADHFTAPDALVCDTPLASADQCPFIWKEWMIFAICAGVFCALIFILSIYLLATRPKD